MTTQERAERLLDAQVGWVMATVEAQRTPDDLAVRATTQPASADAPTLAGDPAALLPG